jgi:hypothetical protein
MDTCAREGARPERSAGARRNCAQMGEFQCQPVRWRSQRTMTVACASWNRRRVGSPGGLGSRPCDRKYPASGHTIAVTALESARRATGWRSNTSHGSGPPGVASAHPASAATSRSRCVRPTGRRRGVARRSREPGSCARTRRSHGTPRATRWRWATVSARAPTGRPPRGRVPALPRSRGRPAGAPPRPRGRGPPGLLRRSPRQIAARTPHRAVRPRSMARADRCQPAGL